MEQQFIPIPEFDLKIMVERSCDLLRIHQPKNKPYYGCFSGGKDSVVIKRLAEMAGVNVVWHYSQTTIDPPELVRFIKKEHSDVIWNKPKKNFFRRLEEKMLPTRRIRWCCSEYKENVSPSGSVLILGVRAAESAARASNWKDITFHKTSRCWAVSPILSWRDQHVCGGR